MDPEFIAHLSRRGLSEAEYLSLPVELKVAVAVSYLSPPKARTGEPVWDFCSYRAAASVGSTVQLGLNGSFTFMCWIKIAAFNVVNQGDNSILGQRECQANATLHLVIRERRPHFGFYCNDTTGTTELTANTWYHLCFVYNAVEGRQTILVNGVVDASTVGHAPLRGDYQTYFATYAGARGLNGYISVPRLWRSALRTDQVREVMMLGTSSTLSRFILEAHGGAGLDICRPQHACMETPSSYPPLYPVSITAQGTPESTGMCSEFGHMYNQQQFSDVVIRYNNQQLSAHRIVLAARSDYFRAMFSSGMQESSSGVVELSDIADEMVASFELFIQLLYTYETSVLADLQSVMGVLVFAMRFDAPVLRGMLQCKATEFVRADNAAEVLAAIEGSNCDVLEAFAFAFVAPL